MKSLDRPSPLIAKAWAATLAAMIVATLPLWVPGRDVPRIASNEWMAAWPPGLDLIGLGLITWGLATTLLRGRPKRKMIAAALAGLALLALPDELRWQAWVYHGAIVGAVLGMASPRLAINLLRWLTVGVYAYSGIAKLDVAFADTLGQQMLIAMGVDVGVLTEPMRRVLALALPVVELVVAGLLTVAIGLPRLRTSAIGLAVLQHVGTIGLLGPWALGHGLGVLLWNVGFATQTAAIFSADSRDTTDMPHRPILNAAASGLVTLVLLSPIAYQFGYGDAWLNWALYAPRGERATVFVTPSALRSLPTVLREHADPEVDGVHRLQLDAWVLRSTQAPLYPQPRVTAAIAAALERRYAFADGISVVIDSRADRWTGERSGKTLAGREELAVASNGRVAVWP